MKRKGFALIFLLILFSSLVVLMTTQAKHSRRQLQIPERQYKRNKSEYITEGVFTELMYYEKNTIEDFIINHNETKKEIQYHPVHTWEKYEPDDIIITFDDGYLSGKIAVISEHYGIQNTVESRFSYVPEFNRDRQLIAPRILGEKELASFMRKISQLKQLDKTYFETEIADETYVSNRDTVIKKKIPDIILNDGEKEKTIPNNKFFIYFNNSKNKLILDNKPGQTIVSLKGILVHYGDIHVYEDYEVEGLIVCPEGEIILHDKAQLVVRGGLWLSDKTRMDNIHYYSRPTVWGGIYQSFPVLRDFAWFGMQKK